MNLEAIETALLSLTSALTEIATEKENGPRSWGGPTAFVSVYAITPVGRDEYSYARAEDVETPYGGPWGGVSKPARETVRGQRELTWRVRIESYDQTPGYGAQTYAERLRTRLAWTSTQATLEAAGLGFQEIAGTNTLDTKIDQRWVSVVVVDVRLNAQSIETDPTLYPTIDRVDASTYRKVD